jgi:hypothetical protein
LDLTSSDIQDSPKYIAQELYNLARDNDALDAVGASTSWRWQEGVISRMPKAATVAAVLTKAFGTEDPKVWHTKVGANLKGYVSSTFKIDLNRKLIMGIGVSDIYDSMFIIALSANHTVGATKEDLIYKLCFLKYAVALDEEDIFELPDDEKILEVYGKWATNKLKSLLSKFECQFENDYYKISDVSIQLESEKHTQNVMELIKLRSRVVGFNSIYDMWKVNWFAMTDEQFIEVERKIIKFHNELLFYMENIISSNTHDKNIKMRFVSLVSNTLPTRGEVLR